MKTLAIVPVLAGVAAADLCDRGSSFIAGNWYCQAVQRISYKGVGVPSSYQDITGMNSDTGECTNVTKPFSGPLAPLDEDLSLHFRGPMTLRQFAVYTPSGASPSASTAASLKRSEQAYHARAYHWEEAEKEREEAKKERGAAHRPGVRPSAYNYRTATINGDVVSWPQSGVARATPAPTLANNVTLGNSSALADNTAPSESVPLTDGEWDRVAYFSSDNNTAEGVTFLNNRGGEGSGVADVIFGASLSFASADSKAGAAESQVFTGTLETGLDEIGIFSGTSCENGDCGFYRPGAVAYEGFKGARKVFLFEFSMPDDGTTGFNQNMPAIWALNGRIPRTQQYGACSCWVSGCGELDFFEVLDPGNFRAKSTIHKTVAGGSGDYFERPVNGFMKLAVVMDGNDLTIEVLDDAYEFSHTLSGTQVLDISDETKVDPSMTNSVFQMAA